MTTLNREQWLTECAEMILGEIIAPHCEIRENFDYRVSVGYAPNTRAKSKVIGVCHSSKVSELGRNEIFIVPTINDSMLVLEVLAHELIHAVDDCLSGHKGEFARIARAIGLEGKLTATYAGEALRDQLAMIHELFGDIPHAKIDQKMMEKPKQKARMLKVWCDCGFKFNASRTQIETVLAAHGEITCNLCQVNAMQFDFG